MAYATAMRIILTAILMVDDDDDDDTEFGRQIALAPIGETNKQRTSTTCSFSSCFV
jgi:hypothetical protein